MAQPGYGHAGEILLIVGLVCSLLTMIGYLAALQGSRKLLLFGRACYATTALSVLGTFGILMFLTYNRRYEYEYVFSHSGNDLHHWYRLAAAWAGQEGSFLLWGSWTAVIGFLVFAKAGKYEARVMPFFVSVLGFLCAILLKQTPFHIIPAPSLADLAANPDWHYPPLNGEGLNPSLQNYWMTIHPPTIFFGFASLAVPFAYAIAAMLWKDYDGWARRVMPYALLSCATLGLGLFMGGFWAYETQGWHGFWAWDPVENASFFPWLAITALAHGLVVQRSRGGMARTNTFLGVLAFSLFLVGTFLTRSGALASKDASGQLLSVHAFDNIGKSAMWLMASMVFVYGGGGLLLWLARVWKMPARAASGETVLSRDFAFFLSVSLMIVACIVVTFGTTTPLFDSWAKSAAGIAVRTVPKNGHIAPLLQQWLTAAPSAAKPIFYNRVMLPIAMLAGLLLGVVPWLAWRKTDSETFLKKLAIPWFVMLGFGFFLVIWVQAAQRDVMAAAAFDPTLTDAADTMKAWISPNVQRVLVVSLGALGCFAALSNAMLAFRVFRAKPLNAGGWIAHVGMGVLIVGIIVSNTFERTERFLLRDGEPAKEVFGYKLSFERMTGKTSIGDDGHMVPVPTVHPEYDRDNAVEIRVTPAGADKATGDEGTAKTFVIDPRWFVFQFSPNEAQNQTMRWPAITRTFGHDFYVGLAADAIYEWPTDDPDRTRPGIVLQPQEKRQIGPYQILYYNPIMEPGKMMAAQIAIVTPQGKVVKATPLKVIGDGQVADRMNTIPEIPFDDGSPGAIYLDRLEPGSRAATLKVSLPGFAGRWAVPLEVTYKPWINLVWTGVLIAVGGTLLAMVRRMLDARSMKDDGPSPDAAEWDAPDDSTAPLAPGPAAAPFAEGRNAKSNGRSKNRPAVN